MKKIKISFTILVLLISNNCSKESSMQKIPEKVEDPQLEIYFTLNVDADIDTSDTDNWLIIHDDKGKLLDYMAYESGSKLVFEAAKDSVTDKITVTEFVFSKDYINDLNDGTTPQTKSEIGIVHELRTFTQLEKGSTKNIVALTDNIQNSSEPITSGKMELTIESIPQIRSMSISTKKGGVANSYSTGPGSDFVSYQHNIDTFQNEDEYFVSIMDGTNSLKYKSFFVPENTANLTLAYSEFEDFDDYFEVDVPDNINFSLDIGGFEDSQEPSRFGGFSLLQVSSGSSNIETKPLKFGYLDRFKKFRTIFNVKTEKFRYAFYKYGDKPTKIEVPTRPNLVIENSSISNFQFSSDLNYEEMVHVWSYIDGPYPFPDYSVTKWSVITSSDFSPIIGEIPNEILKRYPKINIAQMEYTETCINLLTNNNVQSTFDIEELTIFKE